jgi:hypothetical protein
MRERQFENLKMSLFENEMEFAIYFHSSLLSFLPIAIGIQFYILNYSSG